MYIFMIVEGGSRFFQWRGGRLIIERKGFEWKGVGVEVFRIVVKQLVKVWGLGYR